MYKSLGIKSVVYVMSHSGPTGLEDMCAIGSTVRTAVRRSVDPYGGQIFTRSVERSREFHQ